VFGASATPGKMGYILVDHLLGQGFDGELVLVNPRGGTAFGLPMVDAAAAAGADLAVVVTPAAAAPGVVEQCGEAGIEVVIVESAGFAEVGAVDLQQDLVNRSAAAGVHLIGPNCLGLFVGPPRLNLTTLPALPVGGVSLLSQSGGLALHIARRLRSLGNGLDVLVSLGNKVGLGFADALDALAIRRETQSVLLYLEQLDEGDALLDRIAHLSQELPVIAVVGGRTDAGRIAIRSHTGSILSRWDRTAALLTSAGAQVAETLALAVAAAAGGMRAPRGTGRRVFALVDGGGHAVLLADALVRANYELAAPPPQLAEALAAEASQVDNPLDLAGAADSDPGVYSRALAHVLASNFYDAVVIGGIFGGYKELFGEHLGGVEQAAAAEIGRLASEYSCPVVVQTTFAGSSSPALSVARGYGVTSVEWPEEAAAVLSSRLQGWVPVSRTRHVEAGTDPELAGLTDRVLAELDEAGLAHAIGRIVTRDDLPGGDGAWVLRLDGFAHKTVAEAIRLGVPGPDLHRAYDELAMLAQQTGVVERIRLAPMLEVRSELLIAFWRHESGAPGWVIGAGGTGVEEHADVAMGRLPESEGEVLSLLQRTRLGATLAVGTPELLAGLGPFVLRLSTVFRERLPELRELECNPVALTSDGPVVLDVLPGR
jgi:acyl-CoA synthetase (NDP forming)